MSVTVAELQAELLAGPFSVEIDVELDHEERAVLARLGPTAHVLPVLRALLVRDLLAVADLRDRAVMLYAPRVVPRGGAKLRLKLNARLRRLVADRLAGLAVPQGVYLAALIARAGAQLRSVVDIAPEIR